MGAQVLGAREAEFTTREAQAPASTQPRRATATCRQLLWQRTALAATLSMLRLCPIQSTSLQANVGPGLLLSKALSLTLESLEQLWKATVLPPSGIEPAQGMQVADVRQQLHGVVPSCPFSLCTKCLVVP